MISAVVVNYNGGDNILRCLRALEAQSIRLAAVIVVDNGSSDGSPHRIRSAFPAVRLIELGCNLGLTKARNIGIGEVTSELVLVLDDDVYVSHDCVARMIDAYRMERPVAVCPRIVFFPGPEIVQCDGADVHFAGVMTLRHMGRKQKDLPKTARSVGACIGACLLFEVESVRAAGGFDESYFFYFEDMELSLRLRALGYSLVCEPRALIHHDRGEGTAGLSFRQGMAYPARRAFFTIRHRLLTIAIHYRLSTILALLPALACYEMVSLSVVIWRGWFRQWCRAVASLLEEKARIRARRERMQRMRKIGDRDLLSAEMLTFAPGFLRSNKGLTAARLLSLALSSYWRVARRLIR
jgi:GT2 family glycosyltransferase